MLKLTDRCEASRGLSATAELLVSIDYCSRTYINVAIYSECWSNKLNYPLINICYSTAPLYCVSCVMCIIYLII